MRKGTLAPVAAAVLAAVLVAGCSCEPDPEGSSAKLHAPETEVRRVEVRPAEPVRLADPGPDAAWAAREGAVVDGPDGPWFVPPLANGTYVASARRGEFERYRIEVTVVGVPAAKLEELSVADGVVSGRYAGVRFRAAPTGDGAGEATFTVERAAEAAADGAAAEGTLTVRVAAPANATAAWRDLELDGDGPLGPDERAWLEALRESALMPALTYVSLDLACRPEARGVDPAAGAALLFPWQLILKYDAAYPASTARAYARRSACSYFPDDSAGDPEPDAEATATATAAAASRRSAWPPVLILSGESPLPSALGYFPLDGRGAADAPLRPEAVR